MSVGGSNPVEIARIGTQARATAVEAQAPNCNHTAPDADGDRAPVSEAPQGIAPICFTPGTMIDTPQGARLVEELQAGDSVFTRDNGTQVIGWVGARSFQGVELEKHPQFKPVRIASGALGDGFPTRDMVLSPNHRVLVSNDKTALYFEDSEVLVAAKHLTALEGVDIVSPRWVTYIHILCEHHELVCTDGAWTESFQPKDHNMKGIGNAQRLEIESVFPDLKTQEGLASYHAARRSLEKYEADMLTRR